MRQKFYIRYITILLITLVYVAPVLSQSEKKFYFFSDEDILDIRASSKQEWSRNIVNSLKASVEERLKHPLEVPMLEGGHAHDYFCPIHNQMFSFNWLKPTSHYCSLCDKEWTHNNKFNWAWVNEVHNRNLTFLTANMYLYIITQNKRYAEYIRDMLLDYALKYPTYFEHNVARKYSESYSGRMFGQSLDEAVWASNAAKAYSIAKPVMTEQGIKKIEDGYLNVAAKMLLNRKAKGNWQVWHNSGIIALAVALQNTEMIENALHDPEYGYYAMLNSDVRNDGWWNEGSPIYHYYPLRAMLLSAEALRCLNINLYDDRLKKMFVAPAAAVYEDLYFPAHNDGWYGTSLASHAALYEVAYKRYNDPFLLDILKRSYKLTSRNSHNSLLNPTDISKEAISTSRKSAKFDDTGFAVMCANDKTVVMKYGPHGGLHGHPDKLSISIHDGTKEIVTDMGTPAYGVPDCELWYRRSLSHSTVIVDGEDQKATEGKLLSFKPTSKGGFVEAEVSDTYPGVYMKRSVNLNGNIATDLFSVESDTIHTYDYVLIFSEEPQFFEKKSPVKLTEKGAYERLSETNKFKANKSVSFTVGGVKVVLENLSNNDFEVITAKAPGIPPKDTIKANEGFSSSYPVIIRSKGKNMKIKTNWQL